MAVLMAGAGHRLRIPTRRIGRGRHAALGTNRSGNIHDSSTLNDHNESDPPRPKLRAVRSGGLYTGGTWKKNHRHKRDRPSYLERTGKTVPTGGDDDGIGAGKTFFDEQLAFFDPTFRMPRPTALTNQASDHTPLSLTSMPVSRSPLQADNHWTTFEKRQPVKFPVRFCRIQQ
jgi:hypothetical protein